MHNISVLSLQIDYTTSIASSMKKIYQGMLAVIFLIIGVNAYAQTTISGTITDASNDETLAGVNIIVKGKVIGTVTDVDGNFSLKVNDSPPLTLVVSLVGYKSAEVVINDATTSGLSIKLEEQTILAQEVVVSASRVEERILESPVSIEKMDIIEVQTTPADNYYKGLANLKGVDVTTSSINFQILNTRGFGSTGNTRFVQLIDGMDTQAPALNFPIGNLNGPSELDVESVELIPGASSALYGPNAFNGILLVNSKNAFEYQGLSGFAKAGVNHIGSNADQDAAPLYEASVRYAKAFDNKFAFKVNLSYMKADDWHGTSDVDRNASFNPFLSIGGENPGPDRLHYMGDEAALNMNILRFSRNDPSNPDPEKRLGWQTKGTTGAGIFSGNGPNATAWQYAQNGFLPSHVISSPGYKEANIVDYGAENMKLNGGLYYRLSDKHELSYLYNAGFGTSVYTGAQRYSLSNFAIQQHRLQLRGDNFFVRLYTTRERSGDSYIAEFLGKRINDERYDGNVSTYLTDYPLYYLRYLYNQGYRPTDDPNAITLQEQYEAHQYAKDRMASIYPLNEETGDFEEIKKDQLEGVVPFGPLFDDQSNLYHGEFQYDFKNEIEFMDLIGGASYRLFELKSNGTIFPDSTEAILINEFGAYVMASKKISNSLKLSGSLRYDKNENFQGQFNPRISGVYTINGNHNIRASFQTGFRNPTTQGQYISLDIISSRLLGGLPQFYEYYDLTRRSSTNVPLVFTGGSVNNFRNAVFQGLSPFDPAASSLLVPFTEAVPVKPERVKSMEFGYKSLIENSLLIDVVYYYNIYTDFITQIRLVTASELSQSDADDVNDEAGADLVAAGDPSYSSILNGTSNNTFQIYTNLTDRVTAQGAAIGLTYSLPKGYSIGGNYNWNKLIGGFTENNLSEFNTPEHKFNLHFGNRKLTKTLGFNITYRWQDSFLWESSFAIGNVPAYSTVDAQISYRVPDIKSVIKFGGSNIVNERYIQSFGGPNIGAIYYVSVTFDQLMN